MSPKPLVSKKVSIYTYKFSLLLYKLDDILTKPKMLDEKEYYERQLATLKSFEEVESIVARSEKYVMDEQSQVEDQAERAAEERAMQISNWANIFLLALKVWLFFFETKGVTFLIDLFLYIYFEWYMMSTIYVHHMLYNL